MNQGVTHEQEAFLEGRGRERGCSSNRRHRWQRGRSRGSIGSGIIGNRQRSRGKDRACALRPQWQEPVRGSIDDLGVIPLQIKVSTNDTAGALFVFEHADMGKGGPPRHFHYEQDEWFYVTKGEFAFEVGEERFTLHPGDSLFAPRMVPHVWAYIGDEPGTLLLAVQPAGSLEAFFVENVATERPPTLEEAERSFAAYGMEVVGPPLDVG
jgi:quercetin dioxygenase-like cupin family protein